MFFQFEPAQREFCNISLSKPSKALVVRVHLWRVSAAGAALEYLERTQASQMPKIQRYLYLFSRRASGPSMLTLVAISN